MISLRRRRLAAGALLLVGAAACRSTPPTPQPATTSTAPTSQPTVSATVSPWVLVDDSASDAVKEAVLEWAAEAAVAAEPTSFDGPLQPMTPGLVAAVVLEGHLAALEQASPDDLAVVVIEASSVTPGEHRSTLGPDAAYDEAGFLAGVAAGLATGSGVVGILPGPGTATAAAFRAGFEEGVLYSCPRCQVDAVSDPRQPAFAMDVIAVPPGTEMGEPGPGSNGPWLVVFGGAPNGDWGARVAARIRTAPEAIVADALDALWSGDPGVAWAFAATDGSLVTEIDQRAISPGRERLLRQAETALAQGWLAVGDG